MGVRCLLRFPRPCRPPCIFQAARARRFTCASRNYAARRPLDLAFREGLFYGLDREENNSRQRDVKVDELAEHRKALDSAALDARRQQVRRLLAEERASHAPRHRRNAIVARERRAGGARDNMTTTASLLTVPTADTSGFAVCLHMGSRDYIFARPGEGTQRAAMGKSLSLARAEHFFLTGTTQWAQVSGLFGMMISAAASATVMRAAHAENDKERYERGLRPKDRAFPDETSITVHGGENLGHALATGRYAIFKIQAAATVVETRDDKRRDGGMEPDFVDDFVRVWKMPVRRASSRSSQKRMHSPDGEEFKPAPTLSDPRLPALIVEKVMFNGTRFDRMALLPKEIRSLEADEPAMVVENGRLTLYDGARGENAPNGGDTVFAFPRFSVKTKAAREQGGIVLSETVLPPTTYSETSMCYIAKAHDRRGKFNVKEAKARGVHHLDFGKLTAGESVPGADGQMVTPEMVLGPPFPGQGLAFADLPHEDYIQPFLSRPELKHDIMKSVAAMYWHLGKGLAEDPRIRQFANDNPHIRHIFIAEDTCPNMVTNKSQAGLQLRLGKIDRERFPQIHHDNRVTSPAPAPDSPITFGRSGHSLTLMPRLVFNDDAVDPFPDLNQALDVSAANLRRASEADTKVTDPTFLAELEVEDEDFPNRDATVIALGTGSSAPSKYRNVSGTLVRVPGIGSYLFDAGEGTLGQIRRLFGDQETANILRELKCIVISHLHADHHLGCPTVIKSWYEQALADGNTSATLAISCITRYKLLLEDLAQIEDIGLHRLRFPSCPPEGHDTLMHVRDPSSPAPKDPESSTAAGRPGPTTADLAQHGLASIRRIHINHCYGSHATQLELTSGLRMAYSGDGTRSVDFAVQCRGAHLLIHECTYDDDKADLAFVNRHSTVSEALHVARDMKARRVLLTHFSQRYMKGTSLQIVGRNSRSSSRAASPASEVGRVEVSGGDAREGGEAKPKEEIPEGADNRDGDNPGFKKMDTIGGRQLDRGGVSIKSNKTSILAAMDFMTVKLGDWRKAGVYALVVDRHLQALGEKEDKEEKDKEKGSPAAEVVLALKSPKRHKGPKTPMAARTPDVKDDGI